MNLLLRNGAKVDLPKGDNPTALMLAAAKGNTTVNPKNLLVVFIRLIHILVYSGFKVIVDLLIQKGASVDYWNDHNKETIAVTDFLCTHRK